MKKGIFACIASLSILLGLWGCKAEKRADSAEVTESVLYISTDEASTQENSTREAFTSQEKELELASSAGMAEEASEQETQAEKAPAKAEDVSEAAEGKDITEELSRVEEQAKKQMEKLQNAETQVDMNEAASELYQLWDQELNRLWGRLKETLSEAQMSELTARQREWIAFKEEAGKAAGSEYEGGSIQEMIVSQKEAELTRERVYELADWYFGRQAGELSQEEKLVSAENIQETGKGDYDRFSGCYVDTQGTEDIYSALLLTGQGDGKYGAEIGLYRLTTLEGTAKVEGDILFFLDEELQVKGRITIQDGGAIFTVTESEFEYIYPGDVFQFPIKQ